MKKVGLICAVALAGMSLAACNNQSSKESSSSSKASSSKVVKQHKKHSNKESKKNKTSSSSSSVSQQSAPAHSNTSATADDQADPFNASTWDKPYKGYPNFKAYMDDHPNTPNIQSQTAQIQHDNNVKQGIENPDGSETQNFQNWMAYRDRAEANGYSANDYDQNIDYSTGE